MPVKVRATLLAADCAQHPAVTAWGAFSGRTIVPERIDVLWTKHKSTTYRLFGAGPAGTPLIVQCTVAWKAAIEQIVYEQILPCLPLTAPRLYGLMPESAEHAWMFLEDIGDRRYDETDSEHRSLAGRWIGRLHSEASSLPAARALPETGPQRYFRYLETSLRTIGESFDDPVIPAADVDLLRRIAADLEMLLQEWGDVERACAGMPASLAHGDFRPKNACLREGDGGLQLFPIDWETAGWGTPAADLTRIDLSAYLSVVQTWWRGARLEDVQRAAAAGTIFRYLSSIFWLVPQLTSSYKPIPSLRVAHWSLTQAADQMRAIAH
jgi:thiamine kinase-like enzyme